MPIQYDARYDPPAPVLQAVVEGPGGVLAPLSMMVDTGADQSVVPRALARQLRLTVVGAVIVAGTTGGAERAPIYAAWLRFAGARRRVELLALGREGILGRELLSGLVLRLDGPRRRLEIVRRSAHDET